jgi:cytochrome c peroxidase
VALTAPYLHDGSAKSLQDVVAIMARYQLALKLDAADIDRIVAFLHSLTGEYQGRPLE